MGDQQMLFRTLIAVLTGLTKDLLDQGDDERDALTLLSRAKSEGVGFMLRVLPEYGRYIDAGLITGSLPEQVPAGVHRRANGHHSLLRTRMARVFDHGRLMDTASTGDIRVLRQLTHAFKKVQVDFSPDEQSRAAKEWRGRITAPVTLKSPELVDQMRVRITSAFRGFEEFANQTGIVPRHGPGAVAEKLAPAEKWELATWFQSLSGVFPESILRVNDRHLDDRPIAEYRGFGVTRMVLVPKDFRGPRVISAEPCVLQYLQQGIARSLMAYIESHSLLRNAIRFTDQRANQHAAMVASASAASHDYHCFATVDMKDASDRVSQVLVREVFSGLPWLWARLNAVRSQATDIPGWGVTTLQCHAPMGSALCFVVESIVHWALAQAMIDLLPKKYQPRSLGFRGPCVQVYGDDIIIPAYLAADFAVASSNVGLLMNRHKSCFLTPFRESCGSDCFGGELITPIKFSLMAPTRLNGEASVVASLVATHNLLPCGMRHTRAAIRSLPFISAMRIPEVDELDGGLVFRDVPVEHQGPRPRTRYNSDLQRLESRVPHIRCEQESGGLDGWPGVMSSLSALEQRSYEAALALPIRVPAPRGAMHLKGRWTRTSGVTPP